MFILSPICYLLSAARGYRLQTVGYRNFRYPISHILSSTRGAALALTLALTGAAQAQVTITPGATVTQNFSSLGTNAIATLPSGWRASKSTTARQVTAYSSAVTATERAGGASLSTTAANGIYNFGSSATDRAVGGLSSGSDSKSVNLYVALQNTGGSSIPSFSISYKAERYRNGSNSAGFSIQMYYSTDGTTWTSAGSNFLSSFAANADNTGAATVPIETKSVTSQVLANSLAAGSTLYLAWNYAVTSGTTTSNAQALGVSDIEIVAAGGGGTAPGAPTITGITPGDGSLSVAFTPPASDGGAAISNYQYSTDGITYVDRSPASTNSPLLIGGLTNGTTYSVTLKAVNNVGAGTASASTNATPAVPAQPPVVTSTNFSGQVNVPFSQTIPASGSPTNFTLVSGTLPGGLTFNSNNGTISGTPTNAVTNNLTVTAANSAGTSSNATIGLAIAKGDQTITFTNNLSGLVAGSTNALTATANSGLSVTYTSSDSNVATISGNSVVAVGAGSATITASQAGDDNWNAATNVVRTLTVLPNTIAYWDFATATPTTQPVGWTISDLGRGNNNGTTTTLITSTSVSSGYTNSLGIPASGTFNAGAAAGTGSLDVLTTNNAYFEFTVVSPAGNTNLAVTGITFGSRSTSTGPQGYSIRSSADSYASQLAGGSLANNSTWALSSNSLVFPMTNGTTNTFRIYGYNGTGNAGPNTANWRIDDLVVQTGSYVSTDPVITLNPSGVGGLSTFNGTPSSSASYVVSGANLSNNLVISTLTNSIQISSNNTTFTNTLELVPSLGSVSNTTLYVRISDTAVVGAISGSLVQHVSTGKTNNLTVNGNVFDATRGASSNSLIGWDANNLPGGATNFGPSPWSPARVASNLVVSSGFTRGGGLSTTNGNPTGAGRAWGAVGWGESTSEAAISANQFVSFTIAAASGHTLSLSAVSKFDYRRPSSGPTSGLLQVQVGSGSFTDVASLSYSSTNSSGDSLPSIDLSTNSSLQGIPANTPVTFRIVNTGATTNSASWYIFDKGVNPNLDFEVTGSVEPGTGNSAPSITSGGTVSVAENQTAVQTVVGSDPDAGTTLSYSISGGADALLFAIDGSTGALTFVSAPDFENPADVGTDNVYDVTVQVSDGSLTATKDVAVTVTDVNEAPAGSTFAGWSGGATTNSELVGKYGIGGATNISAASEKPVSVVDSNTLSLSAIVRTNDTNLTVVGEAGGSLTNWSTNGVSVTASTNTNGVPDGHQRQVFSVDRTNSPTRQFLRLKATLAP